MPGLTAVQQAFKLLISYHQSLLEAVMKPLTIATAISLLLTVLKIGDILLTKEQQQAIQNFCEDLTLRLEYANVERAYLAFRQLRVQKVIYSLIVALQIMIGTWALWDFARTGDLLSGV